MNDGEVKWLVKWLGARNVFLEIFRFVNFVRNFNCQSSL